MFDTNTGKPRHAALNPLRGAAFRRNDAHDFTSGETRTTPSARYESAARYVTRNASPTCHNHRPLDAGV
jgi:hypothetical protein